MYPTITVSQKVTRRRLLLVESLATAVEVMLDDVLMLLIVLHALLATETAETEQCDGDSMGSAAGAVIALAVRAGMARGLTGKGRKFSGLGVSFFWAETLLLKQWLAKCERCSCSMEQKAAGGRVV